MTGLIKRDDALAAIDMALNNATGDLFDCHAAIRALPAVASATLTPNPVDDSKTANPVVNDPAAIREAALQAHIEELAEERDTARRLLGAATQMQTETQAKLAKAEEALRFCSAAFASTGNITERHLKICNAAVNADAVLAELEGK